MNTFNSKADGTKDLKVYVRSNSLPRNPVGKVVVTSKSGATMTFNDVAKFYESGADFTIPQSYLTSENLPATVTLQVSGTGVTDKTVASGTVSMAADGQNVSGTVEVDNNVGGAITTKLIGTARGGIEKPVLVDDIGRLKQSHAQPDPVSQVVNTIGNTAVIPMDGFASATFYFSGTFAGANFTFEQSPDSTNGTDGTWYPTIGANIGANTAATATGAISANAAWDLSAPGAIYLRARLTAITSGSVTVKATASTASVESAPTVPTHAVTQSGTWVTTSTPVTPVLYSLVTAATTNLAAVKASAGVIYGYRVDNTSASPVFVKVYNKATAPVLASDTPVMTIQVPASATIDIALGEVGRRFSTGIAVSVTGARIKTDATAVSAGVEILIDYV